MSEDTPVIIEEVLIEDDDSDYHEECGPDCELCAGIIQSAGECGPILPPSYVQEFFVNLAVRVLSEHVGQPKADSSLLSQLTSHIRTAVRYCEQIASGGTCTYALNDQLMHAFTAGVSAIYALDD